MKQFILLALLMPLASGSVVAIELGSRAPIKPVDQPVYVAPEEVRQGGDTIQDAMAITFPGVWTGTTVGYNNDYDEACPFTGSTAPEVVYSVTPAADVVVDIDLCYSSFDTKLYVYDQSMNLVGCNDDFYFGGPCYDYSSKLMNVALQGGITYYIIVDGYGSAAGAYQLEIVTPNDPCVLSCPSIAQQEFEPELHDGYVDSYNGGCNSPEWGSPFQMITSHDWFCGVSGWYIGSDGGEHRDTDWFHLEIPAHGVLELYGDAEFPTYMLELAPQDCGSVGVVQTVTMGSCAEAVITIVGVPGSLVWLWVGPTTFSGPVSQYNYMWLLNLPVASESHSWSSVKSLFNR